MNKVSWIKVDVDLYKNEKLRQARAWQGSVECYYVWLALLLIAGRSNASGRLMVTSKVPYSLKMFAKEIDLSEESVKSTLKIFEKLGMIRRRNGVISVTDWENHQNEEKLAILREQARERQRRYRERQMRKEETDGQL